MNFATFPIGANFALFAGAACLVWLAGTRVTVLADQIARGTGFSHAIVGLVLLGGITSLPEIAVGVFAAFGGAPALAVNNLLGGVAMQKAILAAVDGFTGKQALTVVAASPDLLLQSACGIFLLILVAIAIVAGDYPFAGAGVWSWSLLLGYCFSIWTIAGAAKRPAWIPHGWTADEPPAAPAAAEPGTRPDPLPRLLAKTGAAAAVIFVAGFVLSNTADALAAQTGIGQKFVGAVLLALATSLPELSTVITAMRVRQYEMAIADILGTGMFNVALILLIDVLYRGPPVLNQAADFSLFAALLCILLTTIYLIGLVERKNRTVMHFGIDSIAILASYLGGLLLLYQLR
ncbi:sodium:calcium antiporter [Massilia glaciei]|uniref:Sodium:calcium antiporter n=1 Tax=Massilia glaciei TaxID=1524097 RepID=A0A2U2HFX0_9BURK|nr:sodium:calcium antiporter [Massilia glaciei]PWF43620.1 sodium:calcium antiporter [Massilia glaciei]